MIKPSTIDWRLFGPVLILIVISLITLFAIDSQFFYSQIVALFISFCVFFIFSKINIEFLKSFQLYYYIGSVILLLSLLVFGQDIRGATRWFDLFGVQIQISEVVKPILALSLASFIADNSQKGIRAFLMPFVFLVPVFVLIFLQPDLGSAVIYLLTLIFVLFFVGFPIKWLLFSALPFLAISPIVWFRLHDFQRQRILTFLNPGNDPLGTSYNAVQSIIAVGSGGIFGRGLSEGTQSVLKFLPERQTDFIFATIAEALGFLGASIVVASFMFFIFRLYEIFKECEGVFEKVFIASTIGIFMMQGIVNMGMNMGIFPIVGITLPFVSLGGSSLLSSFIFLGIISSIARSNKKDAVLQIG